MKTEFLRDLQEATEEGADRTLLNACPVGKRVNRARGSWLSYPHEEGQSYRRRIEQKLQLSTMKEGCFRVDKCLDCNRGRSALSESAAKHYYCQSRDALDALEALAKTGSGRVLPSACEIGRLINQLANSGDSGDAAHQAAGLLAEQHGCSSVESCLHCPLGKGVLDDLLLDLAEYGKGGDAGKWLSRSPWL